MGSGAKSYMRKGFLLYYMRKCANFSLYMRRPLVIYDFAPDSSEFPYISGNFSFLFYQCKGTYKGLCEGVVELRCQEFMGGGGGGP